MVPKICLLWWVATIAAVSCVEAGSSLSVPQGGIDAAAAAAVATDVQGQRHTTRKVLLFGAASKTVTTSGGSSSGGSSGGGNCLRGGSLSDLTKPDHPCNSDGQREVRYARSGGDHWRPQTVLMLLVGFLIVAAPRQWLAC